jgi:hypothetical protein
MGAGSWGRRGFDCSGNSAPRRLTLQHRSFHCRSGTVARAFRQTISGDAAQRKWHPHSPLDSASCH